MHLSIPWTSLGRDPVKIVLNDIYILARARPPGKVDEEEDERAEQAAKQQKLKSAEQLDRAANQVQVEQGDTGRSLFSVDER